VDELDGRSGSDDVLAVAKLGRRGEKRQRWTKPFPSGG